MYYLSVVLHSSFFLRTEILNKCKGDVSEMKDSKLKTQPSLLENLIFFVEVRHLFFHTFSYLLSTGSDAFHFSTCSFFVQTVCIVLWMASHCAKILRPLKTSLQKKKKKKKDTSTALVQVHLEIFLIN